MYDYFMNIPKKIKELSLRQKINQMFITGFEGDDIQKRPEFNLMLENGLGGVIFFSQNITSTEQIKKTIEKINSNSLIPPFLSIDQEGGRVERTENIHKCKKYLSARFAAEKGVDFLANQTEEMSKELVSYGINMNFAPVLDVNTNENNPIIGERAYSNNPNEVIEFASIVQSIYSKNGIIPVGKHFPGHGDASLDSHLELPVINLLKEELEKNHILPFKDLIQKGIPAIMVAHVHYPALEPQKIPSSMSKNIINDYLINELKFEGVIISDDMVMGAIKDYAPIEACIMAINAGINMFIFRNTTKTVINLVSDLEKAVVENKIDLKKIDLSVEKILKLKEKFNIIATDLSN